jgi:hypothetical protein
MIGRPEGGHRTPKGRKAPFSGDMVFCRVFLFFLYKYLFYIYNWCSGPTPATLHCVSLARPDLIHLPLG